MSGSLHLCVLQIARTLDQVEQTPLDHTSMMVKVLQQRRRGVEQMGGPRDVGGGAGHEGGLVGHYVDKWEGSQVRRCVHVLVLLRWRKNCS